MQVLFTQYIFYAYPPWSLKKRSSEVILCHKRSFAKDIRKPYNKYKNLFYFLLSRMNSDCVDRKLNCMVYFVFVAFQFLMLFKETRKNVNWSYGSAGKTQSKNYYSTRYFIVGLQRITFSSNKETKYGLPPESNDNLPQHSKDIKGRKKQLDENRIQNYNDKK